MNNEGKSLKLKNETLQIIDTILTNFKTNNFSDIPQMCCNLTMILFSDHNLMYTDLNRYFDSSDVALLLMESINVFSDQGKRDILRLLYVLLQVYQTIREKARQCDVFQAFLLSQLDQRECWENQPQFKHHINVASLLLVDRDESEYVFNTSSVRKFALRAIVAGMKKWRQKEIPASLVFYACSMFTSSFEEIPTNNCDEPASEEMLSREIFYKCLDIIRNYIHDFKLFYSTDGGERRRFILYNAKAGYSFLQICKTIIYYSVQSKRLRENLIQSGLYENINNLLSLTEIDETIVQAGIDILKISLIDLTECLNADLFKSINVKLNNQLKREGLPEKVKKSLISLLKSYGGSPNESFERPTEERIVSDPLSNDASLIHFSRVVEDNHMSSTMLSYEKWGTMDVQQWLRENNLESLKVILPNLTGSGLTQLKCLVKAKNSMTVIDYLMHKMKISFDITLEFMGALDKL